MASAAAVPLSCANTTPDPNTQAVQRRCFGDLLWSERGPLVPTRTHLHLLWLRLPDSAVGDVTVELVAGIERSPFRLRR